MWLITHLHMGYACYRRRHEVHRVALSLLYVSRSIRVTEPAWCAGGIGMLSIGKLSGGRAAAQYYARPRAELLWEGVRREVRPAPAPPWAGKLGDPGYTSPGTAPCTPWSAVAPPRRGRVSPADDRRSVTSVAEPLKVDGSAGCDLLSPHHNAHRGVAAQVEEVLERSGVRADMRLLVPQCDSGKRQHRTIVKDQRSVHGPARILNSGRHGRSPGLPGGHQQRVSRGDLFDLPDAAQGSGETPPAEPHARRRSR